MTVAKQIGARIRVLRKAANLSQERLGQGAGLPTSHVGSLERGELDMRLETLGRIARALHVSPAQLVAAEELALYSEVDGLLRGVPPRLRVRMLQVLKDAAVLLKEAAIDSADTNRVSKR